MQIKALVVGISDEVWFKGTRDERKVQQLNCLDRVSCAGQKLKNTFDYTPSAEELLTINVPALDGQLITIGVSDIQVSNARMKVRGRIDLETLPPELLRGTVAAAIAPVRDVGQAVLNNGSTTAKAGK